MSFTGIRNAEVSDLAAIDPNKIDFPVGFFGKRYYVDSTTGSDVNKGTRDAPLATFYQAVTRCRSGYGDAIILKPGHDETIGTTSPGVTTNAMTISVADLRIYGVGTGNASQTTHRKPLIKLTDVKIVFAAQNIGIDGVRIEPSSTMDGTVTTALLSYGASTGGGFIRNCRFTQVGTVGQLAAAIELTNAAANSMVIENNLFIQTAVGGATGAVLLSSTMSELIIRNNYFAGYWTTSAINGTGAITRCLIDGNQFMNQAAGQCITLATSSTGLVSNNRVSNTGTVALLSLPTTVECIGNIGDTGSLDAGAMFQVRKTITSSAIVAAGVDLTGLATGVMTVEDIVLKTNGTGLAGATAVTVESNNVNGQPVIMQTAVAGLGANKTIDFANASVTKIKTYLESGKKLLMKPTVSDGTGAGTVDVIITLRRGAPGAELYPA